MNQHQTDDVTIVAGGWSASKVDLKILPGKIIGVNDAWKYLPRCDIVVSMDRLWAENRWDELCKRMTPAWIRRAALKKVPNIHLPWLRPFDCDYLTYKMSEQEGVLNGNNSGLCAVNLALMPLVRPRKRLWLVGFDMQHGPKGKAHWYPDYPWKQKGQANTKIEGDWHRHFKDAAQKFAALGINVYNVSDRTKIKDFPIVQPNNFRHVLEAARTSPTPPATPDSGIALTMPSALDSGVELD